MRSREIATMLKFCREMSGLTQYDLSAKLHKERTWVSKVENGRETPDVDELIEWSNATNGGEILGRYVAQACGVSELGYREVAEARQIKQIAQQWAVQLS